MNPAHLFLLCAAVAVSYWVGWWTARTNCNVASIAIGATFLNAACGLGLAFSLLAMILNHLNP